MVRDCVIATYAGSTEYTHRGKLADIIHPLIIDSKCDKIRHENSVVPFTQTNEPLKTQATQDVNYQFLQTCFQAIPDDVKQLMDITDLVTELGQYQVSSRSAFGQHTGKTTFEYRPSFDNVGEILIGFDWQLHDEFGELERTDKETNIIPGVIFVQHRYYAITNRFMEWLQEPGKPKRQAFLAQVFH